MRKHYIILLLLSVCMSLPAQSQDSIQNLQTGKLLNVARQYRYGIIREVDLHKAVTIYKYLSKKGNTDAMNELGKMYLNGDGVKQNPKAAFVLFCKASKEGNASAMCNLALMYQKGIGMPTDFKKAFILYRKASELGSAKGFYGAGHLLYKGLGVKQDYKRAISYLKKGAEMNHSGCSFLLGTFYANGFDGAQDLLKAEGYFNLASQNGHGWTVDVTKNGLLDSISQRDSRVKKFVNKPIPTPAFNKETNIVKIDSLIGKWKGVAYVYDWSKTKLIDCDSISCTFEQFGDSVAMYYYKNDSLVTIYTPFERSDYYVENQQKEYQKDFKWVITKSQFEKNRGVLYARLQSLNLKNRDLRRPMVLELHKVFEKGSKGNYSINAVSQQNNSLILNGNLPKATDATISIYTIRGELVKRLVHFNLLTNSNTIDGVVLESGVYIVEIVSANETVSYKFTVK